MTRIQELYKKDLHNPDNHDGMITHLAGMQSQVGLRKHQYNNASGCDGIPVELFQILKDDGVKESAALNMPANLENSAVATRLEKVIFHSSPKERQCQSKLKLPHNCTHLTR